VDADKSRPPVKPETEAERASAMRVLGSLGSAGFAAGITLAIFLLGGYWLDKLLGTSPWLTLAGILLGLGGSFYMLIRTAIGKDGKGK